MSHELVFEIDETGHETGKARLVLRKEGAWHGFGHIFESISLEDCHRILGTAEPVTIEKSYLRIANPNFGKADQDESVDTEPFLYIEVEDSRILTWKNGPWPVQLGTVGDQTAPLQNKDFIDSLKPWIDSGLGEIESAGLLKGGKVIFAQIRANGLEPGVIRTLKDGRPDIILPYIGFSNGHGGKSMSGGRTDIREVCWNTVTAATNQMAENGTALKKTHRSTAAKQDKHAQAAQEMASKMSAIHDFLLKQQRDFMVEIEKLRFLDSVCVKALGAASIDKTLYQFVEKVEKGKKAEDVLAAGYKPGRIELETAALFTTGMGCEGRSWFDAHCAMTELLTHKEGNAMKGDRAGDAEARRHYDLWFGNRKIMLDAALDTALEMARMQA